MATKSTPEKRPATTTAQIQKPVQGPAEKLFDEIKKALHGGVDTKQWLLPKQVNKVECIVPIIVE